MKKITLGELAAVLGLGLLTTFTPTVATGAVVVTTAHGTVNYAVSSTDLLQGPGVLTNTNNLNVNWGESWGGNTVINLTDGLFPPPGGNGFAIASGVLVYTLDTSVNTNGYDISAVNTYGGWPNWGRSRQQYDIAYSTVADPSTFVDITTAVDSGYYIPDVPSYTSVSITENANPWLAEGVKAIRFTFPPQLNGGAGYRELDVIGQASAGTNLVAPTIVTQPQGAAVGVGANVSFSVTSAGSAPLYYQWFKNGTNLLVGRTASSLALSGVGYADVGTYSVVVSNSVSVVTSSNAILNVENVDLSHGTTPYAVSASDLLQSPGVTVDSSQLSVDTATSGGVGVGSLVDGIFSTASTALCISGGVLTYTLNTVSYPQGYTITNISTYGGWPDWSRSEQTYTVSYSTVANPGNFVDVATVDTDDVYFDDAPSYTSISIHNTNSNVLATGVKAIRFTFSSQLNWAIAAPGYRELDVLGSPIVNTNLSAPIIAIQPQDACVLAGSPLTLYVALSSGYPLPVYQWLKNGTNLLTGQTNASLTVSGVGAVDEGSYSVTVSNLYGGVVSRQASIRVVSVTTSHNTTGYTVSSGDLLQWPGVSVDTSLLSVNTGISGGYGVGSLTDGIFNTDSGNNWSLCIASGLLTYTLNTNLNPNGYDISAVNTYGGWPDTGRSEQQYDVAYATVDNPNTFINIATGVNAGPYSSDTPSYTAVSINDVTNSMLATRVAAVRFTFPPQLNGAAGYRELDVLGSPTLTSTLPAAPAIVLQPQDASVVGGGPLTLLAQASGYPTPTYQWFKNVNSLLTGQTNAILALPSVGAGDAGLYSVTASNTYGSVSSRQASVSVLNVTASQSSVPYAVSAADLLQTSLGSADSTSLLYYQWYNYGNVATLTDGIFNTDSSNNWALPIGGGTLTYYLNTATASGGYVVSNINVYGGWPDINRDAQNYTVSYATVFAPTMFVPITTVAHNPPNNLSPSYTSVGISGANGGVLVSNVSAIRFSFRPQENGAAGYREIDVLGAAGPPNTLAPVVAGLRAITTPMRGSTNLVLPAVPSGYSVAIKSSSNPGVIGTNGVINPPATNTVVQLVLTVTQLSNSQSADTGIINLFVPTATGSGPWVHYSDNFTMRRGLFISWSAPPDGQVNPTVLSDGVNATTIDQFALSANVPAVVNQIAGFGFEYVILTDFHGYQTTLHPCAALDSWRGPGCTSTRDLVGELIAGLKARGIKVYLFTHPLDGYDGYSSQQQLLVGWNDSTGNYKTWNNFINDVHAELTERYGDDIAGFQFDSDFGMSGDSRTYHKLDLNRLRQTILSRRPNLSLGALVGPNDTAELGIKEVYVPSWFDPRNSISASNYNVEIWPAYLRVPVVVQGYHWATVVPPAQGVAHLNGSQLFRFSVLQAAAGTEGPGISWAVSPYTDGTWENGVAAAFTNLQAYVQPIAASLTNVLPSTSYPLTEGVKLSTLPNGIAATRSLDGSIEYLHVLNPPGGNTLTLPLPADGKRFASATLLANGHTVTLATNLTQVILTLNGGDSWSSPDTVIKLQVNPTTIPQPSLAFHKHVFASSSLEYGSSWWSGQGALTPWGSIRLVDGKTAAVTSTNGWSAGDYGFSTTLSSYGFSIGLSPTNRPEWITIDFETTNWVNSVRLTPRMDSGNVGQGYPVNFSIYTSTDGVNWTLATNLTSQPMATTAQNFSFSTRAARYVQLYASELRANGGTYGLQLSELEAFGYTSLSGLDIQKIQSSFVLQWTNGVLQSAGTVNDTFTDVGGAVSPYTNNAALGQQFYRLRY